MSGLIALLLILASRSPVLLPSQTLGRLPPHGAQRRPLGVAPRVQCLFLLLLVMETTVVVVVVLVVVPFLCEWVGWCDDKTKVSAAAAAAAAAAACVHERSDAESRARTGLAAGGGGGGGGGGGLEAREAKIRDVDIHGGVHLFCVFTHETNTMTTTRQM